MYVYIYIYVCVCVCVCVCMAYVDYCAPAQKPPTPYTPTLFPYTTLFRSPHRGKNSVLRHRVNAEWGSSVAPKITSGVTHKTTVPPRGKCELGQKLPPTRAAPHPCPNPARVNAPMGLASLSLGTPRCAR